MYPDRVRLIELEGCLNFRDLGGYATRDGRRLRSGLIFRSDALHRMTPSDVRQVRDQLGVRTVVDLRSSAEVAMDGVGLLPLAPVAYHHLPLFDQERGAGEAGEIPDDLSLQYFFLMQVAAEAISTVVEALARAPGPAVFHCAAGKDRTGVISALILGLMDVDDDDIAADYAFTSRNLDGIIDRLRSTPSYNAVLKHLPPSTLHAEARTMSSLLARLRAEYGSLGGYARSTGLSEHTVARLEKKLVEDL